MTNHATMAQTPIDVEINGKPYKASPLTLRDLGHIEQWARSRIVATARQAISEDNGNLKYDDKVLMLDRAYKIAAKISFISDDSSDEMSALFMSIDGMCQIIWSSLRRNHPELTPEALGDLIDVSTLSELAGQVMMVSGFAAVDEDDDKKGGQPSGDSKSV